MSDVNVMVAFRHTQPTQALKNYAEQKIHRVGKFFYHPSNAHVILPLDARLRQLAEIALHTRGTTTHGKERHDDLYAAIDLTADKIGRQIKKQKKTQPKKA
jgi:ribosome hibernation promoting factor